MLERIYAIHCIELSVELVEITHRHLQHARKFFQIRRIDYEIDVVQKSAVQIEGMNRR